MNQVKANSSVFVIFLCAVVIGNCDNDTRDDNDGPPGTFQLNPYPGPCIMTYDRNDDGTMESYHVYTYDNHDNNILDEEFYDDEIIHKNLFTSISYEYEDNLLVKKSLYYAVNDGDVSYINYYTYDSSDNLILYETEDNGDPEKRTPVTAYEYDDQNRLIKKIDQNTKAERIYVYEGDLLIYVMLSKYDKRTNYFYDDNDQLIREEFCKEDGDNININSVYHYEYDNNGLLIKKGYDRNYPEYPGVDQAWLYEWDNRGNLLSETSENEWRRSFIYDCWE